MKNVVILILLPVMLIVSCNSNPSTLTHITVEAAWLHPDQTVVVPVVIPHEYPPEAYINQTPQIAVIEPEAVPETETQTEPDPVVPEVAVAPEDTEHAFDLNNISEEIYRATIEDIRIFIESLNRIIRERNYTAWVDYLSSSYVQQINSQPFLAEKSTELYNRDVIVARNLGRDPRQVQRRTLRNARDYFEYIVVPSRSNDRLDDIDFVSEYRVKAYTKDSRGNWLVLYDLELSDNGWKIVN